MKPKTKLKTYIWGKCNKDLNLAKQLENWNSEIPKIIRCNQYHVFIQLPSPEAGLDIVPRFNYQILIKTKSGLTLARFVGGSTFEKHFVQITEEEYNIAVFGKTETERFQK